MSRKRRRTVIVPQSVLVNICSFLDWFEDRRKIEKVFPSVIKPWYDKIYRILNSWEGDEGKFHTVQGKLHKDNGPAAEYANGAKGWYYRGLSHRPWPKPSYLFITDDGEINYSCKTYGVLHNDFGPARIIDLQAEWWINGELLMRSPVCKDLAKYFYSGTIEVPTWHLIEAEACLLKERFQRKKYYRNKS